MTDWWAQPTLQGSWAVSTLQSPERIPAGPSVRSEFVATTAEERVNILIVDDLPEKLLVLETILADLDTHIVQAKSGAEALQHVLRQDFAVILLDVNMPDMDGYETAEFIRSRKRSALTPIIFITGYAADEIHKSHGYSLGAVDYIFSPVVPEILRTKVKVFVDLFRMTQEVRNHAEQRIALAQEQAAREAAERSAAAVQQSEERFRLASEAVTGFIYEMDVASGRVAVSAGLRELLGYDPEDAGDVGWWIHLIHPDDVSENRFPIDDILVRCPQRYRSEYRVRHRDGQYLHVWDQGLVVSVEGRAQRLVGNVVDITERKRAEQALAEASRRKDEFLAMLAHELRNPLAPIRNALHILRLQESGSGETDWARDMIERNVGQLVRLVDDLLDVSRIDRGKIRLEVEPVELAAVVGQAVEIARPLIDSRRHHLSLSVPKSSVRVSGDATRLAQIVANLLNNAAKYTDEGGQIHIAVERVEDTAMLRVRDTGVGLSREMLDSVFDLFMQVDRSLDRSQGGLGIGLTLVRRLVELHGGSVEAHSDGPGTGSEFIVRLPALTEVGVPAPAVSQPQLPVANGVHRRALVVDDNVDAARSLAMLLKLAGHEVHTVHDGHAALGVVGEFQPDVIFLDIGLPGLDGYEIARRLRAMPEAEDVLLLALTGYGQEDDRRRSFEAGFDQHLVKPIELGTLHAILAAQSHEIIPLKGPAPVSVVN